LAVCFPVPYLFDLERSTGDNFATIEANGHSDSGMEKRDRFIQSTCSIDSSTVSDFLLESFFESSTQLSAFPMMRPYSTGIASVNFLSDFNNSGDDTNQVNSTLEDLTSPANSQSMQARLVRVQIELEELSENFVQGSNTADDIKSIFRLTETLLNIIQEVEEQPQECTASSYTSYQSMPGVVALLLSSCYLSLIHVYQCLVGTLGQEIDGDPAAQSTSTVTEVNKGKEGIPSSGLPFISIGGVKLDIPRSATVKIKIHLLAQNVQHLKMSLQNCAARLSTMCPPTTALSISGAMSMDQNSSRSDDSMLTDGLIGLAISDIQAREETLLRQIRKLLLDPGTKTYITK
jgi:hypothetical protein